MLLAAMLVGGVLAGGVAIAQSTTVSHVCLNAKSKVIKAGDEGLKCKKKQTKVALSGVRGADGADGADGARGAKGAAGADGADGAKGSKGDTGKTGPAGPKGDMGKTGPVGPKGDTGKTGPQGGPASYYTVESSSAKTTSSTKQVGATASCDEGDLATGGGFRVSATDMRPLVSEPNGTSAWSVRGQGESSGAVIIGYVICADL